LEEFYNYYFDDNEEYLYWREVEYDYGNGNDVETSGQNVAENDETNCLGDDNHNKVEELDKDNGDIHSDNIDDNGEEVNENDEQFSSGEKDRKTEDNQNDNKSPKKESETSGRKNSGKRGRQINITTIL